MIITPSKEAVFLDDFRSNLRFDKEVLDLSSGKTTLNKEQQQQQQDDDVDDDDEDEKKNKNNNKKSVRIRGAELETE
jgi:hypothetical protein